MEVFKILGKIAIKNDEAKKSLNETSETAEKTQSKLSRIFQSIGRSAIKNNSEISESNANTGKSLSQIAAESGKTVNQLKSDVGKAAAEYRKQGMSASEAMKKAYADIGYVAGETHKKVDKHLDKTGKKTVDIKAKMKSMFSAIGKGALTSVKALAKVSVAAAKIGVVAATIVATGLTAMTKSAVEQYADYEQLVGGVETLFKDSSDKVVEYANNAYKTAGLSANEYMDTVTSFSASLLQGLEGDTAQAAEYANLAITDILSKATGIINGFIRAINSAISILNKIPKVSISRIDELDAPQLAEGGVLKRGQVGILEGNGAEAVVPLEKNTGWIKKVAEDMAEATGGAVTGDSESLKVLYKILEIIRHIDDNMYEWILTALTEGVRLKLDGREFGRMVKANA